MVEFLTSPAWDGLRNWMGTVGGVVALLIAALTYRRNIKLKREEQARLVYAEATRISRHEAGIRLDNIPSLQGGATQGAGGEGLGQIDEQGNRFGVLPTAQLQVTITVLNESKEIIGPVRIEIIDPMTGVLNRNPHLVFRSVRPGQSAIGELRIRAVDAWSSAAPSIVFRDAGGEWWRRTAVEPVERIHDDPANFAWNDPNRGPSRRKVTGNVWAVSEGADNKVRLSTRWHRFWRGRAGKTPIP